nr:uncharacterized protein At1g03900 [Ipomoea trifida]
MLFTPSTVFVPLSLDGNSRSRSVEISSRVLVNPLVAVFNCTSWSRSVKNSSRVLDSLLVAFRSWRRSMENMSAELVNSSLVIIDCSSWSRSSENLSDSRSRSVEILSRVLVACNNNLSFSESLTVRPSYDALTVPSSLPSAPKAPEKDSELYPQWKRCNALITLWILSRCKSRIDQEVGGDLGENQPDRSLVKLVRGSQQNIVVEKVLSCCGTLMSVDGWTSDENSHIDIRPAINHSLKEGEIIRINIKNKPSAAGASMRSAAGLTSGLKTGKSKTLDLVPPLFEEILIRTVSWIAWCRPKFFFVLC